MSNLNQENRSKVFYGITQNKYPNLILDEEIKLFKFFNLNSDF